MEPDRKSNSTKLGDLRNHITEDGSISLESTYFQESFHSRYGAKREAKEKFLYPAEISRFKKKTSINVLDVCLGMGYNSGIILEELNKASIRINWSGLEIDTRPLKIALSSSLFRKSWSPEVLKIIESIYYFNGWEEQASKGEVLWGDARKTLDEIPENIKFDLIFHDGFSPSKCPEVWSEEFLTSLAKRLINGGRLITYSSAAAIRASLKRAGLNIYSLLPVEKQKKQWSSGTLAAKGEVINSPFQGNQRWQALTPMEEEHLLTRAAIPYRDPTRKSTSLEIISQRKIEQQASRMISSSAWKRKWLN